MPIAKGDVIEDPGRKSPKVDLIHRIARGILVILDADKRLSAAVSENDARFAAVWIEFSRFNPTQPCCGVA